MLEIPAYFFNTTIDEISFANYHNNTSYGDAGIFRQKENDDSFSMDVTVPVGCRAAVYVPAKQNQQVLENGKKINSSEFVKAAGGENGYEIFEVTSGEYKFEVE